MDFSFNVVLLLKLIEERPVLWDKSKFMHKNNLSRQAAWQDICMKLKEDYEDMNKTQKHDFGRLIMKKWTQVRDSYTKDVKKRQASKKAGIPVSSIKYKYSKQLSFLKKSIISTLCHQEEEQSDDRSDDDDDDDDDDDGGGTSIQDEEQSGNTTSEETENKNTNESNSRILHKIKTIMNRKQPDFEENMMHVSVDEDPIPSTSHNDSVSTRTEEAHLLFFKSLLPITATLNTEETLQFKAGVINLLQNIKRQKRNYSHNSQKQSPASSYEPEWI